MRIESCREDYYDLSNLQAAGELLSPLYVVVVLVTVLVSLQVTSCLSRISDSCQRTKPLKSPNVGLRIYLVIVGMLMHLDTFTNICDVNFK